MGMLRNMARTATLCAGLALGTSFAAGSARGETVLRALTYAPASKHEDSMVIFKRWIEKVNTAGAGQLRIEIMGGPEVFSVGDQVNAVGKGLADIVMTFTAHAAMVPEMDTMGLSDLTPTEEREVGYFQLMDEAHRPANVKLIGRTATNGGFHIFSQTPINTLNDFQGLKIRSHSGYDSFFNALGANPIGMAISEIYGGLERGVVNAAPYSIYVYDLGVHEVTKYALDNAFWTSHTTITLINLKKFNSLPEAQQKILTDAQLEVEAEMAGILAGLNAAEKKKLQDAGMTFTSLSPEEAATYRRLSVESRLPFIESRIGAERLARIRAMIMRDN